MDSESGNTNTIARSAARGALALGLRQLFVQGSNVAAGIVLARILEPAEFALWGIITFILTFLIAFGDAGLAASLVRQQAEPEEKDYQAIFTLQQAMVLLVAIVFWLLAPVVTELYKLPPDNVWIFRFVAVALFLTSLMSVPQAKLERHLAFDKLAVVEVVQAVVYNGSAILLTLNGVGTLSFGIALLLRSLVGAGLAFWVSPWRVSLLWDWPRVQPHLAFGLPFQGSKIVNLLKDLIAPTFIAFYIGTAAVGYINWASMVITYPLLAVVLLQRLYMPLFARLSHDMQLFRQALHRIVGLIALVVYTLCFLVLVFRSEITLAVFGAKWLEALVLFLPLTLVNVILAPSIVAMSALNALGYSRTVFLTTLAITIATWMIASIALSQFGWQAWGWANLIVHLIYLYLLISVSQKTQFNWLPTLVPPLIIALGIALIAELIRPYFPWMLALSLALLASIGASYKIWWSALRALRQV